MRTARLDVSDSAAVERLFDEVVEEQGGVDVAFANAGISLEAGVRTRRAASRPSTAPSGTASSA